MPPNVPYLRMMLEAAGVDSSPPLPTITRPKPLAAAMRIAISMASRLWKRPSPPITNVLPAYPSSALKIDWRKFSR